MSSTALNGSKPKYRALFESLKADIVSGRYKPGEKLPSEAALVTRSGASRITVGRAIRELQNLGLVDRVAGSGTYVRRLSPDGRPHLFGLLIPDLGETEIFEPICQGIANAPESREYALLWGHCDPKAEKGSQAWHLCRQYIAKKVSGVFFAPFEYERDAEKTNRRIFQAFRQAKIPLVLLDRRGTETPERDRPDLVGINNRQAAYTATKHLIDLGCRHIGFIGYHGSASTISERVSGYTEALRSHGLKPIVDSSVEAAASKSDTFHWSGRHKIHSLEALVCINDRIAGQLMHLFLQRKIRVPEDIRLIGIDDVSYASLLPVPLTTVHQPTHEIGEAALRVMLDRIQNPKLPPRELLLDGELVIRVSCGANLQSGSD
jgi:GntR family transcriptional regulator, arabinose operon transcriptional repressor